jgi:hypothetical protein
MLFIFSPLILLVPENYHCTILLWCSNVVYSWQLFRQSMYWRAWGSKPPTPMLNLKFSVWVKSLAMNKREEIFFVLTRACLTRVYWFRFIWKKRNGNGSDTVEVTVYDYFKQHWHIELKDSAHYPCLNVGKSKRPTYVPIEVRGHRSSFCHCLNESLMCSCHWEYLCSFAICFRCKGTRRLLRCYSGPRWLRNPGRILARGSLIYCL